MSIKKPFYYINLKVYAYLKNGTLESKEDVIYERINDKQIIKKFKSEFDADEYIQIFGEDQNKVFTILKGFN